MHQNEEYFFWWYAKKSVSLALLFEEHIDGEIYKP